MYHFCLILCSSRVQTDLPSADGCPHSGLLHSQLHHHINEEQQAPREQCAPYSPTLLHSFTHCKHIYRCTNLLSADLVQTTQSSLTSCFLVIFWVNYASLHQWWQFRNGREFSNKMSTKFSQDNPPPFIPHHGLLTAVNKWSDAESKVNVFWCFQVRDLSVAYILVGLTYLYVGVLIFAAFPSPPLFKDCIEPVRFHFSAHVFAI